MQKRTMKNTFPDKGESYIPVCVLVLFLSALVSVLILYISTMAQVQAQKRDVKTKLDSVISEYARLLKSMPFSLRNLYIAVAMRINRRSAGRSGCDGE